uniref:Uncharacterized protein n=1 Tax=Elaeophora elaphi TaxID=1147741 RepID=A0A0R3RLH7_9BILA
MNSNEREEGGEEGESNNTLLPDLPPKVRPKSYSFVGSKDVTYKKNIAKRIGDSEISKINSFEKISSMTNLDSHSKARSFLRDFRKLFMKNKTSMGTASATITSTNITASSVTSSNIMNHSLGSIKMENEMGNLNDSITPLRKKSSSWSQCDAQKLLRKCRKSADSKFASKRINSPIRAQQRNSRKMGPANHAITENTRYKITVYSKVSLLFVETIPFIC